MAEVEYQPETCCACRWVVLGEECPHPPGGMTDPHERCPIHGGALDAEELNPSAPWNTAGMS